MKQIRIAVAALMLLMGSIFGSCTKDTAQEGQQSSPKSILQSIPSYSSMEEVYDIIETATSFENVNDLAEYEEMAGRESIGRLADVFYSNVNYEDFTSQEEAITFCLENAQYIDTIVSPNGDISVTPKWENSPYRYVANKDGLFRVGDMVYRLFKHFAISTSIENLHILINIDEHDVVNLDYSIYHLIFLTHPTKHTDKSASHNYCYNYSDVLRDTAWKGSDDIMVLNLYTTFDIIPNDPHTSDCAGVVKVYNRHKWLGTWWTCKHSVTCHATVTIHKDELGDGNWVTQTSTLNYSKSFNSLTKNVVSFLGTEFSELHLYSFNVTATVPGFTTAHLQHINPSK